MSILGRVVHVVALAGLVLMPLSSRAQTSGAWQTPLADWLVDGYYFGQWIDYMSRYHLADDAHGEPGTPVYASANGRVAAVFDFPGPYNYGGLLLLEHIDAGGTTVVSLHGHLDPGSITVQEGDSVTRGQQVATLGDEDTNGGWVPHLHYGIRNGEYVDPSEGWAYAGYGSAEEMADWFNPSAYIESHKSYVEVLRVPESSLNRFATAAGVSQRRFAKPASATQAFLASGTSYPDALTAAPLTHKGDAPLLLTYTDSIPAETEAELTRVLAKGSRVHLMGGEKIISSKVEERLRTLGFTTNRIAGTTREETALAVAANLANSRSVFIVNRTAFPDAVSAGGPSNLYNVPLLFSDADKLTEVTKRYLTNMPNITHAYLIGGESVLSQQVKRDLVAIPSLRHVERVAGSDRYATNVAMVQRFTPQPQNLVLATGANYPDALTGSGLVFDEQAALLLTDPGKISGGTLEFVNNTRAALDQALVLGGAAAIAPALDQQLASTLNAPLTIASASTAVVSAAEFEAAGKAALSLWSTPERTTVSGLSVPAPTGYESTTKSYRGAQVTSLISEREGLEYAPPIVVSELNGTDFETSGSRNAALATWFGVSEQFIRDHLVEHEGFVEITGLPNLFATRTLVESSADAIKIIEIRLPDQAADLVSSEVEQQL